MKASLKKASPAKKTKQQEAQLAAQAADHTLSDFLLLQEAPASGSELFQEAPASGSELLQQAPASGSELLQQAPGPETAADTDAGTTSAEKGRRHSDRIAKAAARQKWWEK